MLDRFLLSSTIALLLAACASGQSERPGAPEQSAGIERPERLLTAARKIRADQGCAGAAPTYRIAASFGKGHEIAQAELGACLIEISQEEGAEATRRGGRGAGEAGEALGFG